MPSKWKLKIYICDVKSLTKFIGRHYCWGRVRVASNRVCLLCKIQLTLKWRLQDPVFFLESRTLQEQRTVQKTFYLPFWDSSCVVLFVVWGERICKLSSTCFETAKCFALEHVNLCTWLNYTKRILALSVCKLHDILSFVLFVLCMFNFVWNTDYRKKC